MPLIIKSKTNKQKTKIISILKIPCFNGFDLISNYFRV